jgi:nitrous oxidase accessory protein NosD
MKKLICLMIVFCFCASGVTIVQSEQKKNPRYFGVYTDENGICWFTDENGDDFYSIGVSGVSQYPLFSYSNRLEWESNAYNNLNDWGFNTISTDLDKLINGGELSQVPFVYRFRLKQLSYEYDPEWPSDRIPDVFDNRSNGWLNQVDTIISSGIEEYELDTNTYLIGYYTDNEMKWGPEDFFNDALNILDVYMNAGASCPGKQRVIQFFQERYNSISDFNLVWNMDISSWSELENLQELGVEKPWRARSKDIFFYSAFILYYLFVLNRNYNDLVNLISDIEDFSRLVAQRYFSYVNNRLKTYDPNHLNLGVRFHLMGVPQEVLNECAKYVDVISFNYYRYFFYSPKRDVYWWELGRLGGCVSQAEFLKYYYYEQGIANKKPILVGEFSACEIDGIWPEFPKLNVYSQSERGDFYEKYVNECSSKPYFVGQHWFIYTDRPLSSNYGVVDHWDNPYDDFVEKVKRSNSGIVQNHTLSHQYIYTPGYTLNYNNVFKTIGYFGYEGKTYDSISTENLEISEHDHYYYLSNNPVFSSGNPLKQFGNYDLENEGVIHVDDDYNENTSGWNITHFNKIQDGINHANNSDTVYVHEGGYHENIIIEKELTIQGEISSLPSLIGSRYNNNDNDYVVNVNADNVIINSINISSEETFGSPGNFRGCPGILINSRDQIKIQKCKFNKLGDWVDGWCIFVKNSSNLNIENNDFLYEAANNGLVIDGSHNIIVKTNTFNKMKVNGLWISYSDNAEIRDNIFNITQAGIIMVNTNEMNISYNNFTPKSAGEGKGIVLKNAINTEISQNNFYKHNSVNLWIINCNLFGEELSEFFVNKVLCKASNLSELDNTEGLETCVIKCEESGDEIETEKVFKFKNEEGLIQGFINRMTLKNLIELFYGHYMHAAFFYDHQNNNWDDNYWENHIPIFPKKIYGIILNEGIKELHIEYDENPSECPHL